MDKLSFTPPAAPLAMPEQNLDWVPPAASSTKRFAWPPLRVMAARSVVAAATLAGTIYGVSEMYSVAAIGGVAALEWLLIGVFMVAFGWIAFSAGNAVAGLLFVPHRAVPEADDDSLTAIVMPIYNEDPREVFSGLGAMIAEIPAPLRQKFEVFIISDTTNAEVWVAEERALGILRRMAGPTRVWYRRRPKNVHRKAGNVADFVRSWGGRYAHMVMLDADSLMTGRCLAALRGAMIADPKAGIIQSPPILIGGTTPFSRAQQFANTVTGPVVARGVAAWQGEDGNYWGHNAIIRMGAFASAAGLPDLPGKPPFGGTILSHDFIEAALIRRAGWSVTMLPDLLGSYEGAPGDLFGVIKRDRRWAQGNLQHARIIGSAGLRLASRTHLMIGIMAYLMSPVWLLLILTGIALSVQATFVRPEYFPNGFSLFPTWPAFDAERMITLFMISIGVLLLPKAIGYLRALFDGELRRGCGGVVGLTLGTLVELLISTAIAPIMMLAQTGIVASILLGRAVGWMPQARRGGSVPWKSALQFHSVHVLAGVAMAVVALLHSPRLAAWMSPTLIALILAVPISKWAGSYWLGRRLRRLYVMLTPQESAPPETLRAARRLAHYFPASLPDNALTALAEDADLRDGHLLSLQPQERGRGSFDADTALATAKLGEAATLDELAGWLAPGERLALISDGSLLSRALALAERRQERAAA